MSGRIVNVRPKPGFLMDGSGSIVPGGGNPAASLMMAMMRDKLSNAMSGLGTTADRGTYAGYYLNTVTELEVEAAYRTSWLMRKIVDLPPFDMTRNWRAWQTEKDVIEQLEAAEKRHQLKAKCKRAMILARLWGGGAILIGIKGEKDLMQPLKPESVRKDQLAYLHVLPKQKLQAGEEITDPLNEWFGHPEKFMMQPKRGAQVSIHPSRVVAFVGQPVPDGAQQIADWFWGDPLYQSIKSALQNADLAQDGFSALIDEAKNDIIKIPDLMANIATQEYEDRLMHRLATAKMGKSTWRANVLDKEEEWDSRQVTWAGIPDIITSYLQIISGAADIPITRLLGQSPKGLQSSGEGEQLDYNAMIESRQDELLTPALDRLDEIMIRSTLGRDPSDIWWKYNPIARLTKKDAAEIENKRADTIKKYSDTGLIEIDALSTMAKNAIIESGEWPGSEAAFEETDMDVPAIENAEHNAEMQKQLLEGGGADPNELRLPAERQKAAAKDALPVTIGAEITDARPRSLYVSRRLLNADELIRWAKAAGFETTQPAEQMHVTICFSRKPVDWMKVGTDWSGDENGRLRVKPGGARVVEKLGDKGAVALLFRDDHLEWRHQRIHEDSVGAVWDFPEYQPHVTITWNAPADLDLDAIEPYDGPLVFGPERFEEVKDDWEKTIVEDSKAKEE